MDNISFTCNENIIDISSIVDILLEKSNDTHQLHIYTWFEGTVCIPKSGASFIKEKFLKPLFCKDKINIYLYSLLHWNFRIRKKSVLINNQFLPLRNIDCVCSSGFFEYIKNIENTNFQLFKYICENISQREDLLNISKNYRKCNISIFDYFGKTLLFGEENRDITEIYSILQYLELYYLIRRLLYDSCDKKIEICFVLPNDESKYYSNFENDLTQMLILDLQEKIFDVEIIISMYFFKYGDSNNCRPYIDRGKNFAIKQNEIFPLIWKDFS